MDKMARAHLQRAEHHLRLALEIDRVTTAMKETPDQSGTSRPAPANNGTARSRADVIYLFESE